MIEFYINQGSGVSPYLQLIKQVEQGLKLGTLVPGDQLPTVKDVVKKVAINPNTVLKAYKQMEAMGIAQPKAGIGTFIVGHFEPLSKEKHLQLRTELLGWIRKAQMSGVDKETIDAIYQECIQQLRREQVA